MKMVDLFEEKERIYERGVVMKFALAVEVGVCLL